MFSLYASNKSDSYKRGEEISLNQDCYANLQNTFIFDTHFHTQ